MSAKAQELYCIYCLEAKPASDFTKEHVVPDGFGKFSGALTVVNGVCGDCNAYFGNTIDRVLGRETVEGMLRYQTGVKAPSESKKFRTGKRIRMELDVPGTHSGSLVTIAPRVGGPGLAVEQIPQVRIEDPVTGTVVHFTEAEVADPEWPPTQFRGKNLNIGLIARDAAGQTRLEALLRSKNFGGRFEEAPPTPQEAPVGKVSVRMRVEVDEDTRRVMAKIAFNYLAVVQGLDFALQSDFNDIRSYVRYGISGRRPIVYPSLAPSLVGEERGKMQGRAMVHIVGVGWGDPPDMLVGQVALFNNLQYRVILTPHYRGTRPTISGGHAYLVGPNEVVRVQAFMPVD